MLHGIISQVNRIVGTKELGAALRKAQNLARKQGYGLLLWDGYRSQCAVDCFLHWASLPENNLTKNWYYPNIKRNEMVVKGYLDTGMLVPMGGDFDFMDERSHHTASGLTETESRNRDVCAISWRAANLKPTVTNGGIMFWQMNRTQIHILLFALHN